MLQHTFALERNVGSVHDSGGHSAVTPGLRGCPREERSPSRLCSAPRSSGSFLVAPAEMEAPETRSAGDALTAEPDWPGLTPSFSNTRVVRAKGLPRGGERMTSCHGPVPRVDGGCPGAPHPRPRRLSRDTRGWNPWRAEPAPRRVPVSNVVTVSGRLSGEGDTGWGGDPGHKDLCAKCAFCSKDTGSFVLVQEN